MAFMLPEQVESFKTEGVGRFYRFLATVSKPDSLFSFTRVADLDTPPTTKLGPPFCASPVAGFSHAGCSGFRIKNQDVTPCLWSGDSSPSSQPPVGWLLVALVPSPLHQAGVQIQPPEEKFRPMDLMFQVVDRIVYEVFYFVPAEVFE